jgi:hypothetical protein
LQEKALPAAAPALGRARPLDDRAPRRPARRTGSTRRRTHFDLGAASLATRSGVDSVRVT